MPNVLSNTTLQPFNDLTEAIHGGPDEVFDPSHRTFAIMQLSHAGKQVPNWVGTFTLKPSRLETENHGYVPPPPPDFIVSDRLLDVLGLLTAVKFPEFFVRY